MIVDLGTAAEQTPLIEHVMRARRALQGLLVCWPAASAVTFTYEGVRVEVWPDDSHDSVMERWRDTRFAPRPHPTTAPDYEPKHRADGAAR